MQPNPYNVVVRAVDGDGDTQNIDVAIHVLEYHEPPVIDRVYQTERRVPTTPATLSGTGSPPSSAIGSRTGHPVLPQGWTQTWKAASLTIARTPSKPLGLMN